MNHHKRLASHMVPSYLLYVRFNYTQSPEAPTKALKVGYCSAICWQNYCVARIGMLITSVFIWAGFALSWKARAQSSSVDAFLASESPIAKAGLLANIGPSGSQSQGAKTGIIIASPSNQNPDYLYTWTRDSALVIAAVIDQWVKVPSLIVETRLIFFCAF